MFYSLLPLIARLVASPIAPLQTWHLLPEPAVVRLLQQAVGALQDRLAAAALVLQQVRGPKRCPVVRQGWWWCGGAVWKDLAVFDWRAARRMGS